MSALEVWREDDTFIGYKLQEGGASEHEWGIDDLARCFGIWNCNHCGKKEVINSLNPTLYKEDDCIPLLGIEGNTVHINDLSDVKKAYTKTPNVYYIYGALSWLGEYKPNQSLMNSIDFFNKKRCAEWSQAGFCIVDKSLKKLQRIKQAFDEDDAVIRYHTEFSEKAHDTSLIIAIKSKIPQKVKSLWYKIDEYNYNAWSALFQTNLVNKVKFPMNDLFPFLTKKNKLLVLYNRKWYTVQELNDVLDEVKQVGNIRAN